MVCYSSGVNNNCSCWSDGLGSIFRPQDVAPFDRRRSADASSACSGLSDVSSISSKSAVLSRFLTKLVVPVRPAKLSRSMPSLNSNSIIIADGENQRREAYINDGWLLDNRIHETPGRMYDIAALIVDSDTILASQLKKSCLSNNRGLADRRLNESVVADDSVSQIEVKEESAICSYVYAVVFILAAHGLWCIVSCFASDWMKPLFKFKAAPPPPPPLPRRF